MKIYPLKLKNVLKEIIWGGSTLSTKYGLGTPGQSIAEAWTLTLRPDGVNEIENGEARGMTLEEYAKKVGMTALCGEGYADSSPLDFPLLVKLIDAKQSLSVQVHPDNAYAHSHGIDMGKTEMWYIVDCEPGAQLIVGLKDGTDMSSPEFASALDNGNISEYFNYVNVKKGDIFYIPAGLVHAIGGGILIAEIQQNSNTTFRIYDFGRVGADGKPRELHLDKAREAMKTDFSDDHTLTSAMLPDTVGMPVSVVQSEYFSTSLLNLDGGEYTLEGGRMLHVMCVSGCGALVYTDKESGEKITLELPAAHSILVPAAFGSFTIRSDGKASFTLATV